MKHYSAKPIQLALRPSHMLAGLLACACVAVSGLVWILPWPVGIRGLLLVVMAGVTVFYAACDALRLCRHSAVGLTVDTGGRMRLRTRNGAEYTVQARGDSYVSAWLTVLNLRAEDGGKCRSVVILPDAADAEDYRRLRVWLLWGRPEGRGG